MSRENVEIVRRVFESLGGGEIRYPAEFLDPDVEWVNPPYAVESGIRRGRPAFEQAAASISGAFDEFSFEVDEVIDAGDERVLVLTTFVVRGRGSGMEQRQPQGYVWTLRDGRGVRFEWFNSHAEAFEAVGLRDQTMSRENVEVLRRAIDAFNERDLDRFLDECDPEVELHSRVTEVAGVYRGYAGLRSWHQDVIDSWEYSRVELKRVIEVDAQTLVALITLYAKGRGSGVELRQHIAHLDSFRAGKLTRIVTYTDRTQALEAVGLRE